MKLILFILRRNTPITSQIPLDMHRLGQTSHGPGGVLAVKVPDESSALS